MEHRLLHRFLVAQAAPALKTMHLAVTMNMGSGSKASLADSILSKIDEDPDLERKTRMYAEVLDQCTRIAVRRFVLANLDGRKGITLGTTKTDAIAAFVSLALLDRSPTRLRNSNRGSEFPKSGIPKSEGQIPDRFCSAIVLWVPPLPDEALQEQLVSLPPRKKRLSKQLPKLWRNMAKRMAKRMARKALSRSIMAAVAIACQVQTRSMWQIQKEVESRLGLRFASKPHAWAFFYRSVLKHVKIKRRTTRKRRLKIVDKHYGNPIDEYEESMKLAYEDSLSEAMLR